MDQRHQPGEHHPLRLNARAPRSVPYLSWLGCMRLRGEPGKPSCPVLGPPQGQLGKPLPREHPL